MSVDQLGTPSATCILFGPFELNIVERRLSKAGEVVPLGARAFDILAALVDRAGEVVAKAELFAKVWPDVTVEEGSLRVHLSALRKALGDGQFGYKYIANVQGRGYSFIVPVTHQAAGDQQSGSPAHGSNLPIALPGMVGRDAVVRQIQSRLEVERLITILGSGGIGKTRVVLAVGHAVSNDFSGAVVFADLSVQTSREEIAATLASAMGLVVQAGDAEEALLEFLRPRRALIVLDSCEHLIEPTAQIADRIFQCAPMVRLLVSGREALQIAGERVLRLEPLDCPPARPGQTVGELLSYPAARLLMERIAARGVDLALGLDDVPFVAEVCRRLDGIPLAIELAARAAAVFGVRNLATGMDLSLDLLTLKQRTANPRHRTLRAMLDSSHEQLSDVERIVLRRAAIFPGHFTPQAALKVAEYDGTNGSDIACALAGLVEKSLIASYVDAGLVSYRLFETTRSYSLEKLAASGEHEAIARRHADVLRKPAERAETRGILRACRSLKRLVALSMILPRGANASNRGGAEHANPTHARRPAMPLSVKRATAERIRDVGPCPHATEGGTRAHCPFREGRCCRNCRE
jgi:predicted ATPase/DNA-binding winged helix-turn-helix (wHTH) protein